MGVLPEASSIAGDEGEDAAAELAELRRRAYGPDADIGKDAAAGRRLQELEDLLRPSLPPGPASEAAAAASIGPAPMGPAPMGVRPREAAEASLSDAPADAPAVLDTHTADPAETAPSVPQATRVRRRARAVLRERRTWIVGGVGAVVGAAIAAAVMSHPWRGPDQVLGVDPDPPDVLSADYDGYLEILGLDRDGLRAYESASEFTPWVGDLASGGRCMLIARGADGLYGAACAGDGLDPVLDLMPAMWGVPGASGSMIRFVAHGDTVEVWLSGPQPTTDAAPVS